VVFVGEAAARPAEVGDFQFFQGIQHVVPIALCIGYFGFGADPKPAIDTGPEVFGELAVDMFADLLVSLLRIDTDARVFLGGEGRGGGGAPAIRLTNTVFMLFSFTMFCLNESYVMI
jgi:putative uncharacterized protein (fragment)